LHDFYPNLYLRYVYDVFTVFDDKLSCQLFLNLLNAKHKNIRFTVEYAFDTLSFLDVEIKIIGQGVDTWV